MDKETGIFLIIYFKVHVIPGEKKPKPCFE